MSIIPVSCVLYCRSGFEKEAAAEIMQHSQSQQIQGYIKASTNSGYIEFHPTSGHTLEQLNQAITFDGLIFARQILWVLKELKDLPAGDRIEPIINMLTPLALRYNELRLESADTNEGKQLTGFCKKFSKPLGHALQKSNLIDPQSPWRLYGFFIDSSHLHIGISHRENSSASPMGIMRLRMPGSAPSRSTLKLEEAFKSMLTPAEQNHYLCNGMSAVDLGACPGGWTWQLVKRNIRVYAVDNGPMDPALMDSGLVEHIKGDGFKYHPPKPVDWLVCDMVERPLHITRLIARWISQGHCKHSVFNLKLPMKKRYDMVMQCQQLIEEQLHAAKLDYRLRIKHLYHDREEVTCLVVQADT